MLQPLQTLPRPWRRLLPLWAAMVLAGCATAPEAVNPPLPAMPLAFKADAQTGLSSPVAPRAAWWTVYGDPTLDALVSQAEAANTSIQVAAARLAQARAALGAAQAQRAPQLGLVAGAERAGQRALGTAPATTLQVSAPLSYELDLFGRLARASDAAALDAEARDALLHSTRLLVQAQVAQAYFALRALDTELGLVRDGVESYRETLRLTERRYGAGDVAELDVVRVRSEVAATEAEVMALSRQRAQQAHALAVLTGQVAGHFEIAARTDAPTLLPEVPAGLPSTVLARRPDVAAAQRTLLAAQARVGVAQKAWFPSIALTAQGGVASTELAGLFRSSARAWGVGALLSLPLFDGGQREAGLAHARAELDAASASHREQVLGALRDVEDELSALQLLARQSSAQAQAVEAAMRATRLSESRYRNGLVGQLELLDARRTELRNRRAALQVQSAQVQATVRLIRALGGGWEASA